MNTKLEPLGRVKIHVCPKLCGEALTTTAHVMQEWEVDAEGKFMDVITDCLETSHGPDNDNIWTCKKCGEEALLVDAEKYELFYKDDKHCFGVCFYVPISDKLRNDVVLKGNLCEPIAVESDGQFTLFDTAGSSVVGVLLELNMARRYLRVLDTSEIEGGQHEH